MAPAEPLDVPIRWLGAEQTAEDLIVSCEGRVSPATFEFRATRDVLALAHFLADAERHPADLCLGWLELTHDGLAAHRWLAWCRSRLDRADMFIGATDMRMARNAWRWLGRGRLLGGPAYAGLACGGEGDPVQGAACCIGLRRARQIIDGGMAEGFLMST
jgi:hypothetical protein